MKDIEKFIKANRDAFDSYEPGDRVWENLSASFPANKGRTGVLRNMSWMKWAAAAAVIIFLGTGSYYFIAADRTNNDAVSSTIENIPDEYAQELYHFTKLIEIKHKELNKLKKEEPELYRKFSADILKLDSSYQQLKQELPGNPNEEVVLEAMIQNLQLQISERQW